MVAAIDQETLVGNGRVERLSHIAERIVGGPFQGSEYPVSLRDTRRVDLSPPGHAQEDNQFCHRSPHSGPACRHKSCFRDASPTLAASTVPPISANPLGRPVFTGISSEAAPQTNEPWWWPRLISGATKLRIEPHVRRVGMAPMCQPGPRAMIGQTVAELLDEHVGLDIEGIDRLYLNLYQPRLQTGGGVVGFFKGHRGAQWPRPR